MNAHNNSFWGHVWHHSVHHLVVALAVAALVGLAHAAGWLGWLDSAMLRLTGVRAAATAVKAPPGRVQSGDMPEVLLITEAEYAQRFALTSPLDRAALAELLGQALGLATNAPSATQPGLPSTLVLDIDVAADGLNPQAQKALDDWFQAYLKAGNTRLVLPLPLPSAVPAVRQARQQWVRQACGWAGGGRVRFASAEVYAQGGQVMRYGRHLASLGTVPAAQDDLLDGCRISPEELNMRLDPLTQSQLRPLGMVASSPSRIEFVPLNGAYFLARAAHEHRLAPGMAVPAGVLAGKTVFVGGAYEARDRFDSPWSSQTAPINGVSFHAAAYYSSLFSVEQKHWLDALIDIAVGFLAGWVFSLLWAFYRHARSFAGWTGYWVPKLVMLAVLVAAMAGAMGAFYLLSGFMFSHNLWINPGPIVLGVFIKVVLSAERDDHRSLPAASRWITVAFVTAVAAVWLHSLLVHH